MQKIFQILAFLAFFITSFSNDNDELKAVNLINILDTFVLLLT